MMAFFSPSCKPARARRRSQERELLRLFHLGKKLPSGGGEEKRRWMAATGLMKKSCMNDLQYVEVFQVKQWLALLLHSNTALDFLVVVFKDTRPNWRSWNSLYFIIIIECKMDKWEIQNSYFYAHTLLWGAPERKSFVSMTQLAIFQQKGLSCPASYGT